MSEIRECDQCGASRFKTALWHMRDGFMVCNNCAEKIRMSHVKPRWKSGITKAEKAIDAAWERENGKNCRCRCAG